MMNTTKLCRIALANILMEDHTILDGLTDFSLAIYKDDGSYTLAFTANSQKVCIDIHTTSTEEEMVEWMSDTSVSTTHINNVISSHQ